MSACPGLTGLPTVPLSGDARPRTYQGTVTFNKLAPGLHYLWLQTSDTWGHTATLAPIAFTIDYSTIGVQGHVVAIGHDFVDTNTDINNMIGNAVFSFTQANGFARAPAIVALNLGHANDDKDVTNPTDNVNNAISARLQARNATCAGVGPYCYLFRSWPGNASAVNGDEDLAQNLVGRDVLLIYDQNSPTDAGRIGAELPWLNEIKAFASAGGLVIVLDGFNGSNFSQTVTALGNLGDSNDVLSSQDGTSASNDSIELDCRSTSPLATNVGTGTDPNPRAYTGPTNSVGFTIDPAADEIFSVFFQSCGFDCGGFDFKANLSAGIIFRFFGYDPVVMDKIFPLRTTAGPVQVTAAGGQFGRDSNDWALFSNASGTATALCPLRSDGTATSDLPKGGTVSILSVNPSCTCSLPLFVAPGSCPDPACDGICANLPGGQLHSCTARTTASTCADCPGDYTCATPIPGESCALGRRVESVYNIQPTDQFVTVGSFSTAPQDVILNQQPVIADITVPRYVNDQNPNAIYEYYASVGCFSAALAADGDGNDLHTNFPRTNFGSGPCPAGQTCNGGPQHVTGACAYFGNLNTLVDVIEVARDANTGAVVAYAVQMGVTPDASGLCNPNNSQGYCFCVNPNECPGGYPGLWTGWISGANVSSQFVSYPGAATGVTDNASAFLGMFSSGLHEQYRFQQSGIPGAYFVPANATPFSDLRFLSDELFQTDGTHSVLTDTIVVTDNAVNGTPFRFDRNAFLPRFRSFSTSGTTRPTVTWSADAAPTTFDAADLGVAQLFYTPANGSATCTTMNNQSYTAGVDSEWDLYFPPKTATTVTGPAMPNTLPGGAVNCWQPTRFDSVDVEVFDSSGDTQDSVRAAPGIFLDEFNDTNGLAPPATLRVSVGLVPGPG